MSNIGKPTAQQIEEQIIMTIREMAKVYQYPQVTEGVKQQGGLCFSDGYEEMGLVNTAEALSSITIPYFSIKSFASLFWDEQILDFDIIRKSVEYLVYDYNKDDPSAHGTLGFGGTPYIDFRYNDKGSSKIKVDVIEKNLDFTDAAVFVVATLADIKAMELHRSVLIANGVISQSTPSLISQDMISDIDNRIVDGFKVIVGADTGPGNGYSYTSEAIETDKQDFLYFTWSVLETLETLWNYVDSNSGILPESKLEKDVFRGVSIRDWFLGIRSDKRAYLTSRFLSPIDDPKKYIGNTTVDFSKSEFEIDRHLYYNLFALLGLLCTGSQEYDELEKAADFLREKYSDPKAREVYKNEEKGKFKLDGDIYQKYEISKTWSERAFSPLLLKAFSMLRSQYREDAKSGSIAAGCENMQIRIYETLMSDVCKTLKLGDEILDNLWDATQYSIYYTERVVESVCRYYEELYSIDGLVPEYAKDIARFRTTADHGKMVGDLTLDKNEIGSIVINIDNEVIKSSVFDEVQQKLSDIIPSQLESYFDTNGQLYSQLADQVRSELLKEIDLQVKSMVDIKLNTFFNDLAGRFEAGKLKSQDKVVANRIAKIVGFALSGFISNDEPDEEEESLAIIRNFAESIGLAFAELLAMPFARENGWNMDDDNTKNLVGRLRKGINYLVNHCENETKEIDILKTLELAIENERLVTRNTSTVTPN